MQLENEPVGFGLGTMEIGEKRKPSLGTRAMLALYQLTGRAAFCYPLTSLSCVVGGAVRRVIAAPSNTSGPRKAFINLS